MKTSPLPSSKALAATPNALILAREVINIEAAAVQALTQRVDDNFLRALNIILSCEGRVIVSGMGKSGHIARKIAATMSSTGTPAYFVHPAEASHGDLGMITSQDVFIALSYSGESDELMTIVPVIKRQGARLISLTGNPKSSLALAADAHLDGSVAKEACPMGLAPTTSTTAALVLGDALAMALLDAKGFGEEDFARSHPGGSLGRRLLTHVRDIMHTGTQIPAVAQDIMLGDAMLEISRKGLGMTAIVDANRQVLGIYTDGDLRRTLEKRLDFSSTPINSVMSRNPRSISPDALAVEAVRMMEESNISQMLVVDKDNKLVGALNMLDLLRAKVI
ncbi:MAG: arabinose-5-phosphate isomerase [Gallionellales bacterium 35-53-114]|jgi:arabinose-5-phosphate isomerase|nr:MAG: arabinose-5-phosphate isomerase [Gallionellales bacterium 35-53-114]OYZ63773.1 MAG: arabinose-5-phosphate isomerase [Gallionellales bacterium 24-53-125]OZB09395.1 MAG: arabinose-5-phosphate isomerase [Gallionellales bacterium 39-52-133]HQS57949.1 KpsF/GutQ family sugar-phosphate isomerase [Gallionellaceae bacterium]HQS76110.1 KpsF/GutQ family sugar-phosphate isomerase [Gallionellaceae bacterium]